MGKTTEQPSFPLGWLGTDWATSQSLHAARWAEQVAVVLAEGQASWFRGMETWTEQLMRPWFGNLPATAVAAPATFDPSASSAGPFGAAIANWNAIGEIWVNALRHDIGAPPAPRADAAAR